MSVSMGTWKALLLAQCCVKDVSLEDDNSAQRCLGAEVKNLEELTL